MLSASAVPSKVLRTASRVIDGEALVMVIDRRELHRLNAVGTRVLELCDGKNSVAMIAAAIQREFDVELDVAVEDVRRFLAELGDAGALSFEETI
jgi:hypothetical protein